MPADHTDAGPGAGFPESDDPLEARQTRLPLENPVDIPATLINTGLVCVIVWPLYPPWALALWLGLVGIVSSMRALLRRR